jgi:ankyrin repeat protein
VKKQIVIMLAFAVFILDSVHAQTIDFFDLVKYGTPKDIQVALKEGVNVNARDEFNVTPLMLAASNNTDPVVLIILLNAGADPKVRNADGKTAFDYVQGNPMLWDTDAYQILQNAARQAANQ